MQTLTFLQLEKVCKSLNLERQNRGGATVIWKGRKGENKVDIVIHMHNAKKNIPKGTLRYYIKQLGFDNPNDFFEYCRSKKIK